jgi:hypothetical protein
MGGTVCAGLAKHNRKQKSRRIAGFGPDPSPVSAELRHRASFDSASVTVRRASLVYADLYAIGFRHPMCIAWRGGSFRLTSVSIALVVNCFGGQLTCTQQRAHDVQSFPLRER